MGKPSKGKLNGLVCRKCEIEIDGNEPGYLRVCEICEAAEDKSPCCHAEIGVRHEESDPNPECSRGFTEKFEVLVCLQCDQDIEE